MNNNDKFFEDFEKSYIEANEAIVLSPDFTARTLGAVFGTEKRKIISFKKVFTVLAAAVLLVAAFAGTAVAVNYIINAEKKSSSMNQFDYYSSASDEYIEFVGVSDESNGLTLTVSEAFMENGILNIIIDFEESGISQPIGIIPYGVSVSCNDLISPYYDFTGVSYNTERGHWYLMKYDLSECKFRDTASFDLSINMVKTHYISDRWEKVKGPWNFSFTISTGVIESDTICYTIDKHITLKNGESIYLDKIVCSPMSQRIQYILPEREYDEFSASCLVYAVSNDYRYDFRFDHSYGRLAESLNYKPEEFDLSADRITLTLVVKEDMETFLCDPIEIECIREKE